MDQGCPRSPVTSKTGFLNARSLASARAGAPPPTDHSDPTSSLRPGSTVSNRGDTFPALQMQCNRLQTTSPTCAPREKCSCRNPRRTGHAANAADSGSIPVPYHSSIASHFLTHSLKGHQRHLLCSVPFLEDFPVITSKKDQSAAVIDYSQQAPVRRFLRRIFWDGLF